MLRGSAGNTMRNCQKSEYKAQEDIGSCPQEVKNAMMFGVFVAQADSLALMEEGKCCIPKRL